jgi:GT2 family glycosyltransferase/glycosyltransferase involved in cell wall biosynthesis
MQILSLDPARRVDNVPLLFYQVKQLVESGDYKACIVLADPLNLMIWALEGVKIPKQTRVLIQPIINQDGYQHWKENREFRHRLAGILQKADAALSLTRRGTEVTFMRQEGIKPVYLPNAVAAPSPAAGDFRKEFNLPENEFMILHVANLYAVKNHVGLLQALQDIPEDWKLVMIGHPSGEPETVARFYQELSRHPRVLHIPGLPPERTAAAMEAADLIVLASKGEVSPLSILEAMSHRKPWLATPDCGAVVDHAGGMIAPLENFRNVLQVLKDCPDLRHQLGELGYCHIQSSYSWPAVIQGWEELIEKGRLVTTFEMPGSISGPMDLLRKQVEQKVSALCPSLPKVATPGQPGKHTVKASQKKRSLVSVIIPTCNRPRELLRALESVVSQTYPNLEIIIVNDGNGDLKPLLKRFQNRRPVKLVAHQQNRGAGAARNTGLRAARGEYIAFLDDDDIYYPEHIRTLVDTLESNPALVAAYSDANQTTLDMTGEEPAVLDQGVVFSQDFSPERFLVCNYIPILCLMLKRSAIEKVGFFDETLPALEDWEWLVRLSRVGSFRHEPVATAEYFVYRGSKSRNSLSAESLGKLYAEIYSRCAPFTNPEGFKAQCQFYTQLTGRNLADVLRDGHLNRIISEKFQKPGEGLKPMEVEKEYPVDIVIPVYGQAGLVKACVDSLLRTVPGARLFLVDDCSPDPATQSLLNSYSRQPQITVARNAQNLGFIGTTRHGAQLGQAPYILFLNSDTEAVEAGWLEKLLPTDEQIAVVGAKLLYPPDVPDMRAGMIQHAGVARNPDLIPYHPFLGWPAQSPETNLRREVNAVTGACLLVRRKVWNEIGGWDDRFGRGVYEDVDLCWQVRRHGYRVLYQPEVILYHRESASIDADGSHNLHAHSKENVEKLIKKWSGLRSDEAIFYGVKAYQKMEQGRRWIRKAEQALARGDLNTAYSSVGRAVKEAPQLASALTSFAQLLSRRGEHLRAAEYIERALKEAPHNWQLHLFLMEEWISAGELHRAVSVLDELLRVFPNEPGLQKRKQVIAGWLSKKDSASSPSLLPDETAPVPPDSPALDRSQALLASLLDAEDLVAALEEHSSDLDENLLALVQDNAAAARADGDLELAEGLDNLSSYLEEVISLRQPQEN